MKSFLKKTYTNFFGRFYNANSNTVILNGHDFNMPGLSADICKNKVNDLLKELSKKYKLIGLDEAIHNIYNKKINSLQIAFTFDDGFSQCIDISDVFYYNNLSAGFFISTAYLNGDKINLPLHKYNKSFLNKNDILSIYKLGHIIGSHTHTHVSLNNISDSNFHEEIIKPKKIIETIIKSKCNYFAPPYGIADQLSDKMLLKIQDEYKYILWSNKNNLFSMERSNINRRHFELDWSFNSLNYFLSKRK